MLQNGLGREQVCQSGKETHSNHPVGEAGSRRAVWKCCMAVPGESEPVAREDKWLGEIHWQAYVQGVHVDSSLSMTLKIV